MGVLTALDQDLISKSGAAFGGGTMIALRYDEYDTPAISISCAQHKTRAIASYAKRFTANKRRPFSVIWKDSS